ncbi:MAG: Ig domain-containing protein [Opitutaceae bacterium]
MPIITNSPLTAAGTVGTAFNFAIAASGLPTSYSANSLPAGLSLNTTTGVVSGTPTAAGTFLVTIGAANSTGSGSAVVTLVIAVQPTSRITNFSARARSGPGSESLIVGFVVAGNNKNLLVRGIGPTLASFGVVNFMTDPMLTLSNASGVIASNDDWQIASDGPLLAATAARVGAFALPNGSKDSALLATFSDGAHSTTMVRASGTTGVALTEIFDTDLTATSRLINVSARMNVAAGEGALIAGFIIAGNAPKTVLIRGVGPSLAAYGVAGVLADPQIALFSNTTQIASNDNWEVGASTPAQITTASAGVGAFAFAGGSKDAALMITLQPGGYSVLVTGVGNATGVALIEIYDTQ